MSIVNVSEARQTLPAQLDRVEAGDEVSITRHGRVVAVLVRPDVLAARRAPETWDRADRIAAMLDRARREPVKSSAVSAARADALVRAVQEDRSAR